MMNSTNQVMMFSGDKVKRFSLFDAYKELKRQVTFKVWMSFIDPRTDCLVQGDFLFYAKSMRTYCKFHSCYLSEHNGLELKLPCSLAWATTENWVNFLHKGSVIILEPHILIEGEYKKVEFSVEVGKHIRVEKAFLD